MVVEESPATFATSLPLLLLFCCFCVVANFDGVPVWGAGASAYCVTRICNFDPKSRNDKPFTRDPK